MSDGGTSAGSVNGGGGTRAGSGGGGTGGSGTTCDGGPVGDCACIKVTTNGDDAAATASSGVQPFRNVNAAIDFAAAHPDVARNVCVAAGSACGAYASFPGPTNGSDFHMRDGIGVYGKYESTSWTRCADSTTLLMPATPVGVLFGPEIETETILDGFSLQVLTQGAAITAEGARGVVLSNLVVRSYVNEGRFAGLVLDGAPGARVENSHFLVNGNGALDPSQSAAAIRLLGDVDGSRILNNQAIATGPYFDLVALSVEDCTGELRVRGNTLTASNPTSGFAAGQPWTRAVDIRGTCSVVMESNSVSSNGGNGISNVALACDAACTLVNNNMWVDKTGTTPNGAQGSAIALSCTRCEEISDNTITGLVEPSGLHLSTSYTSTAAIVNGAELIARNRFFGGCSGQAVGLDATNARIENNVIIGRTEFCGYTPPYTNQGIGLIARGNIDAHSNLIGGGTAPSSLGVQSSGGIVMRNNIVGGYPYAVSGAPATMESNNFQGKLSTGSGEYTTALELNQVPNVTTSGNFTDYCPVTSLTDFHLTFDSLCIDKGTSLAAPSTDRDGELRDTRPDVGPDEWSAAHDLCYGVTCSGHGNCSRYSDHAECQCHPGYRQVAGDPLSCEFYPCYDNGGCDWQVSCTETEAGTVSCGPCPEGFSGSGETTCTDIDECATDNGGCDPLRACINLQGGRFCDACPAGYVAVGDDCVETHTCDPSPCQRGAACVASLDDYFCNCAYGNMGKNCELTFTKIDGGYHFFCGLRTDGTLRCWGSNFEGESAYPAGSFVDVSVGYRHSCAVRSDGSVECWGVEASQPPATDGPFASVSAGTSHDCGVRADGTIRCWGRNDAGEATPPDGSFIAVASGDRRTCGIRSDGTLTCWGLTSDFVLPTGTFQALDLTNVHACGLRTDGTLACWGSDTNWAAFAPTGTFTGVSIGSGFGIARRTDGTLAHFGYTQDGLGGGRPGNFTLASANYGAECAVRSDNQRVTCWGPSDFNQTTAPWGLP
jgi:hypothetical protein